MAHGSSLKEFKAYREKMNEKILERGNLQIKRFFHLDTQAYNDGALPRKTKELMGLVASLVLRCDDCVTYHIIQCVESFVPDLHLTCAISSFGNSPLKTVVAERMILNLDCEPLDPRFRRWTL